MSEAETAAVRTRHAFEFRGTGTEYFGIWIVNLILTVLTLGIFSAWAKVRTRRFFNGSTFVAGHNFDYHASGFRILIGRIIALVLLVAYNMTILIAPGIGGVIWFVILLFVLPWLVISSVRFNARNTSYRNIRFNFTTTEMDAFLAFMLWPLLGILTLGILWPFAQRQKDMFLINNHSFGGRYFETNFPLWRMYAIFGIGLAAMAALIFVESGLMFSLIWSGEQHIANGPSLNPMEGGIIVALLVFYLPLFLIAPAIHAMIVNLTVGNTVFDDRHRIESTMNPLSMAWIVLSNAVLVFFTMGLFYPWAKVRAARYQVEHTALIVQGDADSYVSEVFETQSAVGEEIGSVFDFDFGL